ncbi:hypothetical protein N431DRAFT_509004 [Stipitochalara longipes BDJ]|nr:hypothetical protein N431DRAFT_509004 [Stipitochalara longipes BDJ]
MPNYVVFFLVAHRPEANPTKDDKEITEDPHFQKMLHEFLSWIQAEIKAERIKGSEFLLEASDETNIRIDFQNTYPEPEAESEKNDSEPTLPPPKSAMTRGHQGDTTANILGYFTAEFPTVDDVVAWGRSCPISYNGFALEIRQLKDLKNSISEAPPEATEWVGDHIVAKRKELVEEGKLKKEEDGTQWVKLEDGEEIKKIIAEAEEREAQKDQE